MHSIVKYGMGRVFQLTGEKVYVIIPIPKKGELTDCNNWWGIDLFSSPSKIFCRVVVNRLSTAVYELRKEQAGYRQGRGCAEHIFTLRDMIEQCTEWQRMLYIGFVDFQKAFDSVHRDCLWSILRMYGIPSRNEAAIKHFYTDFSCSVGSSDLSFLVKGGDWAGMPHVKPTVQHRHRLGPMLNYRRKEKGNTLDTDICFGSPRLFRRGTPFSGLYGESPPERAAFSKLAVY